MDLNVTLEPEQGFPGLSPAADGLSCGGSPRLSPFPPPSFDPSEQTPVLVIWDPCFEVICSESRTGLKISQIKADDTGSSRTNPH
ncbi:hypothetical protein FQA47_001794 [Oryzias melastigma]|uniref:Uncharacterized protein n=1 Tax=Oryzias melastigma TaxID=30732 RepID=A0A834L0F2_ORYME|nr:hypothetical protein FQA47_001794 [Oryzias melastigma]